MYNAPMLRKLAVTVVLVLGLVAALAVQADSVRAEGDKRPVTSPISAPISVAGRVLYKYMGQVRPAVGAQVIVKNPAGVVLTVATSDSEGKYAVSASGYGYYILNASDSYGTIFAPANKRVDAGMQLTGADFAGKRPL